MPNPPVVPQPEEQVGHRRPAAEREDGDDGQAGGALGQRGGLGDAVAAGAAQRGRQDALAAQGEDVPPYAVVERQRGGEQAGQEQQLGGLGQPAAAEPEQQPRTLRAGGGDHMRRAGVRGHGPGRARVDHARSRPARCRWPPGWSAAGCGLPRPVPGPARTPTKPSTAMTASTPNVPNPAEPSADGDSVAKLRCPPAGRAGPETVSAMMTIDLGGQQDAQHLAGDVDARPGRAR